MTESRQDILSNPRGEAGTLLLLVAMAVVFFLGTGFLVATYRSKERQLGREWFAEGQRSLDVQPLQAVVAFENALRYDGNETRYRYGLVQALLASGRTSQAEAYLLSMWEQQPANGRVNLSLARIAAARGDLVQSTRYYHNAIYGVWDDAPQPHRIQARLELAELLLAKGATREADAELVALAANNPMGADLARRAGELFLRAGDPDSALEQFQGALKAAPEDPEALSGAGKAAFALGRYSDAEHYLARARARGAADADTMDKLQLAQWIRESDPLDRRASWAARAQRAMDALQLSHARLQSCAGQLASRPGDARPELEQSLQRLDDSLREADLKKLRQDPDLLISVAGQAFAAEETAAKYCGTPQGKDQALLLIGRSHSEVSP